MFMFTCTFADDAILARNFRGGEETMSYGRIGAGCVGWLDALVFVVVTYYLVHSTYFY